MRWVPGTHMVEERTGSCKLSFVLFLILFGWFGLVVLFLFWFGFGFWVFKTEFLCVSSAVLEFTL